jgi:5-methylcytosine-specific restriction endonuclease McrA
MDTKNLPKTRAEAKATGASHYFTGLPCKHGHIAPRKTKGVCIECLKEEWKQSAEKRSDYFSAYNQREEVKDAKNSWYIKNRDRVIQAANTTPAHIKREYRRAWNERNKAKVLLNTSIRRRRHREATPAWLTAKQKAEIRHIYEIAITMTKTTGEQYVVDHIVPLRSEVVCGLHVPWNLRVITQEENSKKSNRLEVAP